MRERLAGCTSGSTRAEWPNVFSHASTTIERSSIRLPIFVDGKPLSVPFLADVTSGKSPPTDLQTRHLWDEQFPSWESPGVVNVKDEPYGAVGDGVTDDADAIQRAVDEHEIVFLPKGHYAVSKTIRLRPDTKLIGRPPLLLLAAATGSGRR